MTACELVSRVDRRVPFFITEVIGDALSGPSPIHGFECGRTDVCPDAARSTHTKPAGRCIRVRGRRGVGPGPPRPAARRGAAPPAPRARALSGEIKVKAVDDGSVIIRVSCDRPRSNGDASTLSRVRSL